MRQLHLKILLLLLFSLSHLSSAQVVDYCSSDNALRVCDLDGENLTHSYSAGSTQTASLDFQVQSCKWQSSKNRCHNTNTLDYTVAVTGENDGSSFLLTGPGDAKLPVTFSYTDATNFTANIPANGTEQTYYGTNALLPTALTVTVDTLTAQSLLQGDYTAQFTLAAAQFGGCGSSGCTTFSDITFTVTVTIEARIVVTRLDDIPLTRPASNTQAIAAREDICVGGAGFSQYKVKFSSQNGSSGAGGGSYPFQLNGNNTAHSLPYAVAFAGTTTTTSGTDAASDGSVSGSFTRTADLNCSADNATIFVTIPASDWNSAIDTNYTDTLSITVTPE